jgi:hypothetical protein
MACTIACPKIVHRVVFNTLVGLMVIYNNNNNNEENLRPEVEVRTLNFPSLPYLMEEVSRFMFLHIFEGYGRQFSMPKGKQNCTSKSNGRLLCFP